ncbi:MAG: DUF192 domain-containing protein [Hyphomicrobiales bacterium]
MSVLRAFRNFAIAVSAIAAAWSFPAAAQEPARIEPLTVVTADSTATFTAEIADTDDLRERGLMFRQRLPEDKAMLFDFGQPRPAAMWMKNTYVSLDMLFVREDGSIAAVAENTEPLSLQTISVQEPVKGVVEVVAGTVRRLKIKRGDHVINPIFRTEAVAP